jgi:ankyrin repeat protein
MREAGAGPERDARLALQNGQTPLMAASSNGNLDVVGALLAKSADVKAKSDVSIARACALCPSRSLAHM